MTDEQSTQQTEQAQQPAGEAWREVGQQFKALGESLATALRAAWHSEENRRQLQEMQAGLEAMAEEVNRAVKETVASPKAQKVKSEVGRAAGSARSAGEKALQEARPHLLSALQQVNAEVQKIIRRLEEDAPAAQAPAEEEGTD